MAYFDGKLVSAEWAVVLNAARKAGVSFHLNSGRRTMAEQWGLWRLYHGTGHAVAYPSPFAPHIRVGRCDHALDIENTTGGADRLDVWCTDQHFPLDNTVPSESWHKEIRGGSARLREFARRIEANTDAPTLRRSTKLTSAIRRVQRLLRSLHYDAPLNGRYDLKTRRAVRSFQGAHHLHVDGVVGPKTWAAIKAATNKS